ncbi:pleckstrin homology domain-containing family A member 8 [Lissotriton helveticus]
MEGELHKWTNYYSGWQPRWFILSGGILSYYDSREEAWKGSKGSIQMAVCEIQVHPTDSTRVDLIIPGQQRFYLRAHSATERQRWLVALGSAKACLADIRTKKETEFGDHISALKEKMSELRLRCDLLIQQLNTIKASSAAPCTSADPPAQEVIEADVLLQSTTNAFLKTLEECMQISHTTFNLNVAPQESKPAGVPKPKKVKQPELSSGIKAERLAELNNNCENGPGIPNRIFREVTVIPNDVQAHPLSPERSHEAPAPRNLQEKATGDDTPDAVCKSCAADSDSGSHSVPSEGDSLQEPSTASQSEVEQDHGEDRTQVKTFFSIMSHRFNDIVLLEEDGIPTQLFLDSCYAIVPVLDKLGPTVFAPVKMDFVGNIKKINQKFITQKEEFHTLQSIVLHEVTNNVTGVRNSATEALLWLKRGLKFLKEFLTEVKNGEKNIDTALSIAYGKTLRQYHGWVVRGVFALALKAAPTYDNFAAALAVGDGDDWKEAFEWAMQRDLDIYLPAMGKQLALLDALYEEYNLESDEVV